MWPQIKRGKLKGLRERDLAFYEDCNFRLKALDKRIFR